MKHAVKEESNKMHNVERCSLRCSNMDIAMLQWPRLADTKRSSAFEMWVWVKMKKMSWGQRIRLRNSTGSAKKLEYLRHNAPTQTRMDRTYLETRLTVVGHDGAEDVGRSNEDDESDYNTTVERRVTERLCEYKAMHKNRSVWWKRLSRTCNVAEDRRKEDGCNINYCETRGYVLP